MLFCTPVFLCFTIDIFMLNSTLIASVPLIWGVHTLSNLINVEGLFLFFSSLHFFEFWGVLCFFHGLKVFCI